MIDGVGMMSQRENDSLVSSWTAIWQCLQLRDFKSSLLVRVEEVCHSELRGKQTGGPLMQELEGQVQSGQDYGRGNPQCEDSG